MSYLLTAHPSYQSSYALYLYKKQQLICCINKSKLKVSVQTQYCCFIIIVKSSSVREVAALSRSYTGKPHMGLTSIFCSCEKGPCLHSSRCQFAQTVLRGQRRLN